MRPFEPRHIKLRSLALCAALLAFTPTSSSGANSSQLTSCQKKIEANARSFHRLIWSKLLSCTQRIVDCKLASEIDAVDPTACLAAAGTFCAGLPASFDTQQDKKESSAVLKCGLIPIGELEQHIAGLGFFGVNSGCGASDAAGLLECVMDEVRCSSERQIFIADPRAQDSLDAVSLGLSFPCVAP